MTQQTSLYVPADAAGMVALNREWLGARLVFVVGFVIAFAFVGWWSYAHRVVTDQFGNVVSTAGSADDQMNEAVASGKTTKEGFDYFQLTFCSKNFGNALSAVKCRLSVLLVFGGLWMCERLHLISSHICQINQFHCELELQLITSLT